MWAAGRRHDGPRGTDRQSDGGDAARRRRGRRGATRGRGHRSPRPALREADDGPGPAHVDGPSTAPVLRLVLLGDSAAIGVGVEWLSETVGGQLARMLAEGTPRPANGTVFLSSVGVAGSRSTDLATQVARALLGDRPDVAVVLIGQNDATALRGARGRGELPRARPSGGCGRRVCRSSWVRARTWAPSGRSRRRCARSPAGGTPDGAGSGPGRDSRRAAWSWIWARRPARCSAPTRDAVIRRLPPLADGYRVWAHALYPAVARPQWRGVRQSRVRTAGVAQRVRIGVTRKYFPSKLPAS
jgi:lysophospholipase L1-like esterase